MTTACVPAVQLRALIREWTRIASEHMFDTDLIPWWLDHTLRLQSISMAAETLGWRTKPKRNPEDPSVPWDLRIKTPNTRMVARCVGAGVFLRRREANPDVIDDAWRLLTDTSPPPDTIGIFLVAVIPMIPDAGDESAQRRAVTRWLNANTWHDANGLASWVESHHPFPRNSAGTVFPGIGLIARSTRRRV